MLTVVAFAALVTAVNWPFPPYDSTGPPSAESDVVPPELIDQETLVQMLARVRDGGLDAIPSLIANARNGRADQGTTVAALTKIGPPALPSLEICLEDPSETVRLVATRTIRCLASQLQQQADAIIPGLIKRLSDESGEVRYATIVAMMSFGSNTQQAVPALATVLCEADGFSKADITCIQQSAAQVLGKLGPSAKSAVPALTRVLNDKGSRARDDVAFALWRITGDTNMFLPQLSVMLTDADPMTRRQAAIAIRRIGVNP